MDDSSRSPRHRLDKWLWCTRFFKTRSLATAAVAGGRAKANGQRVKPAHEVRIGDRVSVTIEEDEIEIDVRALPARRGPAPEARACYVETPESLARREAGREQRRVNRLSRAAPEGRPDKRERRQLDRLRRNQD